MVLTADESKMRLQPFWPDVNRCQLLARQRIDLGPDCFSEPP